MRSLWLQLPLVLGLALLSWICEIDATGNVAATNMLWGATAIAGTLLALRLLSRVR